MIIKHGLVVDPASGLSEHMDILVKNGKIARIAPEISEDSEEILEAGGLVVGPGLIDTHVHFRDPGFTYKEDIHTGAKASAKGGFTTVICMANTSPTVDNTDTLKDNLARASKEDIRIFQAAAISRSLKGQDEVDMLALKEAGACGFTDDGIPLLNAEFCYQAASIGCCPLFCDHYVFGRSSRWRFCRYHSIQEELLAAALEDFIS